MPFFTNRGIMAISGAVATTWDQVTKGPGVDLSNGNLTGTTNSTTSAFAFSTTTRSASKLYFELLFGGGVAFTPTSWYAGIIDASSSFPNGYVLAQNSSWLVNNSATGVVNQFPASGDFAAVAIDFPNKSIWMKVDSDPRWNADAGADPATNTGGASFAAAVISGNFKILCNLQDNVGQVITLNAGLSAFHFTPPSGFSSWG